MDTIRVAKAHSMYVLQKTFKEAVARLQVMSVWQQQCNDAYVQCCGIPCLAYPRLSLLRHGYGRHAAKLSSAHLQPCNSTVQC